MANKHLTNWPKLPSISFIVDFEHGSWIFNLFQTCPCHKQQWSCHPRNPWIHHQTSQQCKEQKMYNKLDKFKWSLKLLRKMSQGVSTQVKSMWKTTAEKDQNKTQFYFNEYIQYIFFNLFIFCSQTWYH
jgi:hypothetical protein